MKKVFGFLLAMLILGASAEALYYGMFREDLFRTAVQTVASSENTAGVPRRDSESSKPAAADVQEQKPISIDDAAAEDQRLKVTDAQPKVEGFSFQKCRSGYASLEDSQKELYAKLLDGAYQVTVKKNKQGYYSTQMVTLKGTELDDSQIKRTVTELRNDNPQLFWISSAYSYAYSGTNTSVQLYSVLSADQCNSAIRELNARITEIIAGMPGDLSELDRELYLFGKVADSCSYDDDAAADSSKWRGYTAYGALVEGKAVCEGYSRAMQALLNHVGMQCRLVEGTADGVRHMWNLVRVEKQWYHLDATWDDGTTLVRYRYFNLSDSLIKLDHVPEEKNLPACTSLEANYFHARAIPVSSENGSENDAVAAAIAKAAKGKKPSVSFWFSEKLDYDKTVREIFQQEPYRLMEYLELANRQLPEGGKINEEKVLYAEEKELRGVTVKLSYQ